MRTKFVILETGSNFPLKPIRIAIENDQAMYIVHVSHKSCLVVNWLMWVLSYINRVYSNIQ